MICRFTSAHTNNISHISSFAVGFRAVTIEPLHKVCARARCRNILNWKYSPSIHPSNRSVGRSVGRFAYKQQRHMAQHDRIALQVESNENHINWLRKNCNSIVDPSIERLTDRPTDRRPTVQSIKRSNGNWNSFLGINRWRKKKTKNKRNKHGFSLSKPKMTISQMANLIQIGLASMVRPGPFQRVNKQTHHTLCLHRCTKAARLNVCEYAGSVKQK